MKRFAGLEKWSTKGLDPQVARIFERLKEMKLAVTVDGDWIDRESGLQMHKNHLRCILKNEYRTHGGERTGRDLDKFVDGLLEGCRRAAVHVFEKGSAISTEIELHDQYL